MRDEVRRNINYSMVSRCQDNGTEHLQDYKFLYPRTIWDRITWKRVGITLAIFLAGGIVYAIIREAIIPSFH